MKHIIGGNPAIPSPTVKTLTIDEDGVGQRLDNYLMRVLKGVPKTHIYRVIRSGEVRVNKGRAAADTRLGLGDVLRVPPVRVSEAAQAKSAAMAAHAGSKAPAKNFLILFEDDWLMAVNKPAGVAVHGGSGVSFGVIEQLRMARPQAKFLELVHRLDRETSGILLIAKKRSALTHLQDQFRQRETGKTYLALVLGQWPVNKKVLDKPLEKYLIASSGEGEGERRVRVVGRDHPDGMPSLSLVKVRASSGALDVPGQSGDQAGSGYSLLEVTIKTGRTHQIRVHLASEGMPIAGDDKYGDFEVNKALARMVPTPLKRMFLHAWRLQCTHPGNGESMELRAVLPLDLSQFLQFAMPEKAAPT